jgi:Cyclin-dependent kinase inhibitor 3 (CDKN3)
MMLPDIKRIRSIEPFKIALMARPRSGEWLADEIAGLKHLGVNALVSLIEKHEIDELGLIEEGPLCLQNGIEYISHPIVDRGAPKSFETLRNLAERLSTKVKDGESIVIHCRAGIGRTGLVAACVMLHLDYPFDGIFATLSKARGVPVPDTDSQISWVKSYAKFRSNPP